MGIEPFGVSSDGTHVWVANSADNTVTELDASTGAVIQTIAVGIEPEGVSSDGTHVWVTNSGTDTVTELDASTGAVIQTITVGREPFGVSSDGTHVWVANSADGTVTELDASTGAVIQTITVGSNPAGVSSDGTHVWVTNDVFGGNTVTELDAFTGAVIQTITVGSRLVGISSDRTNVWVANETVPGTVNEILIDASQVISFTGPGTGTAGGSASLTATGGGSGNPVVFTVDASSGAGVCHVSGTNGSTVNYTGAGSCVIDANQAAGNGYAAAAQVQQTITVYQAPAFVLDSPPLTAVAGQAYDYTFEASGAPAPTYALASGAPSWLSVDASTGEVTGTPPAGTSTFSYKVTATNVAGVVTAGPFTVTVAKPSSDADISAMLSCPASMTVGGTGTCTLTVANAGPATASQVAAGILLPAALSEISCTSGCARHANALTWTLTSLASGASAKFAITVKASAKGNVLVLAAAASQNPDPHPLNNISIRQITITR